jgi:hypothetical protein
LQINETFFLAAELGLTSYVKNVEEVVRKMEARFGQAERILVMDRGMLSEATIDFLRHFAAELAEEKTWEVVQHWLQARVVAHPDWDGSQKTVLSVVLVCRGDREPNGRKCLW